MFMIMLILNDADYCQEILDAWDAAGAPGVTVLASTGLGHIRSRQGLHDDLPLMPSLKDFLEQGENMHRTLISIIQDRETVDRIIKATHDELGDLNRPNTGILVILPVLEAYGLNRYDQ